MSQLVLADDIDVQSEKKGRAIYKRNEHLRRLAHIMEHPEFREFYEEYMKDWEDTKTILMFMKVYSSIEKHSEVELTPFQKLCILKDVIDDSSFREKLCSGVNIASNVLQDSKRHNYIE